MMKEKIRNFIDCRINDYFQWSLESAIRSSIRDPGVIMDIGCGKRPQQFVKSPFKQYLIDPTLRDLDRTDFRAVCGTWNHANLLMSHNRVDTVFLMDVIEHLIKEEGQQLLIETERMVKKHIVVFTPQGFMPQEDGPWNTHRSGWDVEDFPEKDGWRNHIFNRFHRFDFKGRRLKKPVNALLAIYTSGKKI